MAYLQSTSMAYYSRFLMIPLSNIYAQREMLINEHSFSLQLLMSS